MTFLSGKKCERGLKRKNHEQLTQQKMNVPVVKAIVQMDRFFSISSSFLQGILLIHCLKFNMTSLCCFELQKGPSFMKITFLSLKFSSFVLLFLAFLFTLNLL